MARNLIQRLAANYGSGRTRSYYGNGMNRGGYVNAGTGTGTGGDKMRFAEVVPTRITNRESLEIVATELWQIRRMIEVVPEDMVLRWREFETGDNADIAREMMEQEKKFRIKKKLKQLAKAARTFGTACLIVMSKDAPLNEPLNPEWMREGDLRNLILVDRFNLTSNEDIEDMFDMDFGTPAEYRWEAGKFGTHDIHHSRIIRYDAAEFIPRYGHGYGSYESEWGMPVIIPILLEVFRDEDLSASVQAQMLRAGTLALTIANMNAMMAGNAERGIGGRQGEGKSLSDILSEFASGVTSHRMVAMHKGSEANFLSPMFSGIANIIDAQRARLAGAFGMPQTRLWGSSPGGLNATGDSDMEQYSDMIGANQEDKFTPVMDFIDQLLAVNAGIPLNRIPEYRWMPYRIQDAKRQAEILELKIKALVLALQAEIVTVDEVRSTLDGDALLGELEDWDGESPLEMDKVIEMVRQNQLEEEKQKTEEEGEDDEAKEAVLRNAA